MQSKPGAPPIPKDFFKVRLSPSPNWGHCETNISFSFSPLSPLLFFFSTLSLCSYLFASEREASWLQDHRRKKIRKDGCQKRRANKKHGKLFSAGQGKWQPLAGKSTSTTTKKKPNSNQTISKKKQQTTHIRIRNNQNKNKNLENPKNKTKNTFSFFFTFFLFSRAARAKCAFSWWLEVCA